MEIFNEIICVCMNVRKQQIEDAIRTNKLTDIDEIGDVTEAGTDCGACHDDLKSIFVQIFKL